MTMPCADHKLYVGLMCGTSADAIDAALVQWKDREIPSLLATHSHPLSPLLRNDLLSLNNEPSISLRKLSSLDTQVAREHSSAVFHLLSSASVEPEQVEAIGFHGQTIDHAPEHPICNTTQIGNPHLLASATNISVIADFRRADIAAGGQGAPLAPALHAELLRSSHQDVAVVNIGGIANLSLLPADSEQVVLGFDTGPGNCLMDVWVKKHKGLAYDEYGQLAKSGRIKPPLLADWLSHPYFQRAPPKSTGRDLFNLPWLEQTLMGKNHNPEDVQASLAALTAQSIVEDLKRYLPSSKQLYVCGGGANNTHLMQCLQQSLPNSNVCTTNVRGIDPDWMEAILMAWLARQYCLGLAGNLPSVTGAESFVHLGVRFEPPGAIGRSS